jgi:small-conductance mechanosensitive channel
MEHAWQDLQGRDVLGVPVLRWALFLAITIVVFAALRIALGVVRKRLAARASRGGRAADTYLARLLERTWTLTLLAVSVLAALAFESLKPAAMTGRATADRTLRTMALLVLFLQVGRWGNSLIDTALEQGFRFAKFSETAAQTAFGVVRFFAMVALWTVVATLVLGSFGVEVTPLLAGLGVGGVAVAFALQRILGDIFCSVAIVLDRPFEVGDFIQVGDAMGTVERIGVRTTRARSPGGEQVVFPNSDLLQSRIRNFKRLAERRVVFHFDVPSDTPVATVETIPGRARAIIEGLEKARFDRAHLTAFSGSAFTFEVVYFVLDPEIHAAMDVQQRINLELIRALEGLGIRGQKAAERIEPGG